MRISPKQIKSSGNKEALFMSYCTKAFGAYDIRGIYPATINEEVAYRIGRFFLSLFGAKKVVVDNDIRLSG